MTEGAALPLILMTTGAIAMPAAARKLAIPVAVAEIVFGVAIGQSGFDIAGDPNNPFIKFLAELGFTFFLFLAGLEIDFRGFERKGVRSLLLPFLLSVGAFGLSIGAAQLLGWGLWVGLAIGATAVPLLRAVGREAGLNGTPLGNTMITFAAMGELLTIVALSLVEISEHSHGLGETAFGVGRMLLLSVAVVMVVGVLRTLLWWFPDSFAPLVAHDDASEIGLRVGYFLMFLFVGLSIAAGVEPFLGAFVAGAILSYVVREAEALEHKVASMAYGFFVPVFFIHVGLRLEITPQFMWDNLGSMLAIVAMMAAVKLAPGSLLFIRGMKLRSVTATSLLLAAPLTLVIAIMDLGERAGAVSAALSAEVITAGILASLLFPSLARKLLRQRPGPENAAVHEGGHT
ncbi:MAG: cation:proton antiporter [Myxococcota bacterium]|nr:cation:proton antiporter [Myxococcota bacterium]MEC8422805.1 cation:proton antiporter [Myxococcota bacterium]